MGPSPAGRQRTIACAFLPLCGGRVLRLSCLEDVRNMACDQPRGRALGGLDLRAIRRCRAHSRAAAA